MLALEVVLAEWTPCPPSSSMSGLRVGGKAAIEIGAALPLARHV